MRILVAADNVDSADCLARLLKIAGHELRVAYDGPTALALATTLQPKVVLLDIGIPGLSGYEVAQRIRQNSETKNATLVAITGWRQPEDQERSREAGFDYHLLKPVNPESLQQLLASILNTVDRSGRQVSLTSVELQQVGGRGKEFCGDSDRASISQVPTHYRFHEPAALDRLALLENARTLL